MLDNNSFIEIVNKIPKVEFESLYPALVSENWFSAKELRTYSFPKSASSLAGRYLIKKAVADQLAFDFNKSEIEILNNDFGKPEITFGSIVNQLLSQNGINKVFCSISHSRNMIASLTILSTDTQKDL
jgi:phosphopantetheinyl transferase (holo-ACP synthase)